MLEGLFDEESKSIASGSFAPYHKRGRQFALRRQVEELFPDQAILEEVALDRVTRRHARGAPWRVDVYLPQLRLALEYQGELHYSDGSMFLPASGRAQIDAEKRAAIQAAGITLIEVPFWWTLDTSRLKAELETRRPDLFAERAQEAPPASTHEV